jgi:hypothetical protein
MLGCAVNTQSLLASPHFFIRLLPPAFVSRQTDHRWVAARLQSARQLGIRHSPKRIRQFHENNRDVSGVEPQRMQFRVEFDVFLRFRERYLIGSKLAGQG